MQILSLCTVTVVQKLSIQLTSYFWLLIFSLDPVKSTLKNPNIPIFVSIISETYGNNGTVPFGNGNGSPNIVICSPCVSVDAGV
ncbi:unnamed protein product [Enterobius vermicularis]|uniref:Secreted protein n=1 Tax=Enterobius vermicularis TaxID=51028 RepID=A0A0N4VES0_ENTVE|nr:unnamed protein product [Enterobius vermicularis]